MNPSITRVNYESKYMFETKFNDNKNIKFIITIASHYWTCDIKLGDKFQEVHFIYSIRYNEISFHHHLNFKEKINIIKLIPVKFLFYLIDYCVADYKENGSPSIYNFTSATDYFKFHENNKKSNTIGFKFPKNGLIEYYG